MIRIVLINMAVLCMGIAAQAQEKLVLSQSECREMALAHNEDLKTADNSLLQAEIDKAVAFSNYLPKFDGSFMSEYMTNMEMSGMTLQMQGMYCAGIMVTQPIYTGGKIRAANKLAKIGVEASKETQRKTRMEVIADADNAYWSYISVQSKIKMLHQYMLQMDTLFRQVKTSVDAGMSTESDLLNVDAQRSEISYQLQKVVNGANLCRLALCNVIGCSFDTEIEATDTIIVTSIPTQLDEDMSQRPELALLQKQVEANKQQVKVTRADILPQIAVLGTYMWYGNIKMKGTTTDSDGNSVAYSQKFNDGLGIVALSVSVPLFHWGEGLKKVKKAKFDVRNAELELEKNTRLMTIEVRQAIQNVEDSYRMVETAKRSCALNDENLRVKNNQYLNGMCSLYDLLASEALWMEAQSNLIEAQTQQKINETEYLRVTGKL